MEHKTMYAPAERVTAEEAVLEHDRLTSTEYLNDVLDAFPDPVALLNSTRQVVLANEALVKAVGADGIESILGERPGEAFGCISVHSGGWDCGTSERCRYCGAVNAILEAQKGISASKECRLTLVSNGVESDMDILVTAVPFSVEGAEYTLMTIEDISDEKRRRGLERIFFHDVINTAASLDALMQTLNRAPEELDVVEELQTAEIICGSLLEEIAAQRDLAAAEQGDLAVIPSSFDCARLSNEVADTLSHHKVAAGKTIKVKEDAGALLVHSDKRLVRRIISNMVKNALEASPEGSLITIGYGASAPGVTFQVHNPGFIPREVQLQLFQRTFSTKGNGRGLGTYSMKVLAQYLHGSVTFVTSEEEGTTFTLELPLELAG
jgi:hypothetical protein